MTNPKQEYSKRGIITPAETDLILTDCDKISDPYFRLRAKALICLLKKFGKRRSEIARLGITDLNIEGNELIISFTLSKKRKKGLFQYLAFCEKKLPEMLNKPLPEIREAHKEWQKTERGHRVINGKSLHSIELNDPFTAPILEYKDYLKTIEPNCVWLFPSGKEVFGQSYLIIPERHLSGCQLLNIIKSLKKDIWCHLFRETLGGAVAKEHGSTLTSVNAVKEALDLEHETTAYAYVKRFVAKKRKEK